MFVKPFIPTGGNSGCEKLKACSLFFVVVTVSKDGIELFIESKAVIKKKNY